MEKGEAVQTYQGQERQGVLTVAWKLHDVAQRVFPELTSTARDG